MRAILCQETEESTTESHSPSISPDFTDGVIPPPDYFADPKFAAHASKNRDLTRLVKTMSKIGLVVTTALLWFDRLVLEILPRARRSEDGLHFVESESGHDRLLELRKLNLRMFGFDEKLADIEPEQFAWNETNYPLLDGYYFSPFNITSKNREAQQGRESRRVVCWYEGLCYDYLYPVVPRSDNETFRQQQCNRMAKTGKWNISPYPVYFRGAVAWNGNESMQWTTQNGCTHKIYYYRDAFRCLKRHALYFIGGHRSRQTLLAFKNLMNDTLVMTDVPPRTQNQIIKDTIKPLQDRIDPKFAISLSHQPLDSDRPFIRSTSNHVSLPILRDQHMAYKIIIVNPLPYESNQEQLDFIKALVRNLQPDSTVKLIAVLASEPTDVVDSNLMAFNAQIDKLTKGISKVVFLSAGLMSNEGASAGGDGDSYVPFNTEVSIPPNIRVNLNLILNYYCNSQQKATHMADKSELEYIKRWKNIGAAGALPIGGLTFFGIFKYVNNKYPKPGCLQRRNGVVGALVGSVGMSFFIYAGTWYYGMVAERQRLQKDSLLRLWLTPDGKKVDDTSTLYPTKEEAAKSLGIDPDYVNSEWKVDQLSPLAKRQIGLTTSDSGNDDTTFDGKKV